jgi:hypothetical protein
MIILSDCAYHLRFRSSLRILDNDKFEPGFGVLLLQPGNAPFQLLDSVQFKDDAPYTSFAFCTIITEILKPV